MKQLFAFLLIVGSGALLISLWWYWPDLEVKWVNLQNDRAVAAWKRCIAADPVLSQLPKLVGTKEDVCLHFLDAYKRKPGREGELMP